VFFLFFIFLSQPFFPLYPALAFAPDNVSKLFVKLEVSLEGIDEEEQY
jgi:hypothetical protein